MKTTFKLDGLDRAASGDMQIIRASPLHQPYVIIDVTRLGVTSSLTIRDGDLERFAVNILKALKSKKLSSTTKERLDK